jgi:hypothetical protein
MLGLDPLFSGLFRARRRSRDLGFPAKYSLTVRSVWLDLADERRSEETRISFSRINRENREMPHSIEAVEVAFFLGKLPY